MATGFDHSFDPARKLVVVGDASAQKTALLLAFVKERYPFRPYDPHYIPTVFQSCVADVEVVNQAGKKRDVKLALWEVTGQSDYDKELSYRDTDVILVCFSVKDQDSFENVQYKWIPEIKRYCPDVPFLIVGHQTDLEDDTKLLGEPETRRRLRGRVPAEDARWLAEQVGAVAYMECCARSRKRVKKVFHAAALASLQETKKRQSSRESREVLFEKALKQGYVETRMIVSLFLGVAGAGKTHTKQLILKKPPPEIRRSTPLAVRPIRAIRITTTGEDWEEIDDEDVDEMVADAIVAGLPSRERAPRVGRFLVKKLKTLRRSFYSHSTTTAKLQHPSPTPKPSQNLPSTSSASTRLAIEKAWHTELEKVLDNLSESSGSKQLLDVDWIYLIDSGGQREFYETLPAFLNHPSLNIFVLRLCERLNEHPSIEYYAQSGQRIGRPRCSYFTNEELLMRCAQTIQSQHFSPEAPDSKLVIVGTHRDLEEECPETRKEKNERLLSILSPAFDQSLVFHGQQLNEVIFPVNAKVPESDDFEVAKELRAEILRATSHVPRKKTPVSWFILEQVIHRIARVLNRSVLSREECLQIAQYLHLSEEAFDVALEHLASLNVLHYYPQILPNVIFTDPQVLLEKFTELVEFHYQLQANPDCQKATSGKLRRFRDKACIVVGLLAQFPHHYTNLFTPESFLQLMVDRLLAAQRISSDEYFMPCLLPMLQPEEFNLHRVTLQSAAPLIICFPNGWAPHGVFCSLIASLLSSHGSLHLKLFPRPDYPTQPECLTRNCVKFQLPEDAPGALTLIDSFAYFEAHMETHCSVCSHICPLIQEGLLEGLRNAAATLRYHNLHPEVALFCPLHTAPSSTLISHRPHPSKNATPQADEKTSIPHLATISKQFGLWKCTHNPTLSGGLTQDHLVWFPQEAQAAHCSVVTENTPTGDQPTLPELIRFRGRERRINIPQQVSTNFWNFGILLLDDEDGARLRSIVHECRENPEQINMKVLEEWIAGRGKHPISWDTLIEVLRDIELCTLANDIAAIKCQHE